MPNTAAFLTGRASDLCWRDAELPVSCGVIVQRATACRWRSYLADDEKTTDAFWRSATGRGTEWRARAPSLLAGQYHPGRSS